MCQISEEEEVLLLFRTKTRGLLFTCSHPVRPFHGLGFPPLVSLREGRTHTLRGNQLVDLIELSALMVAER